MDLIKAIESRRSIKHFDPNHIMTEAEINQLFTLACLSPSAFNLQHWRFVVIQDMELRKQIRAISWNQAQVTDASLFFVICGNLKAWNINPQRYYQNSPEHIQQRIVSSVQKYYQGQDQVERDEAFRSCGIVSGILMLAAKGMGYDSCAMDGFDFDQMAKLIHLPKDHIIVMSMAIGKLIGEPRERNPRLPLEEVVILNHFE